MLAKTVQVSKEEIAELKKALSIMQSSTPAPSEVLQDTAQAAASNSAQCSYVAAANASESSTEGRVPGTYVSLNAHTYFYPCFWEANS